MSRTGISGDGRVQTGWEHVVECIRRILSTELGSRVQRRDFGSLIPRLLDKPQNEETLVNFYMATAEALYPRRVRGQWYGEPCFRLERCTLDASVLGEVSLLISGSYLPRGHLGDFKQSSPREIIFSATRLLDAIVTEAVD